MTGEITVPGLNSSIQILREKDTGITHIFADDELSSYFGLGYAHASDWLWQLTYFSKLAMGRLSEILGEKALPIDKAIWNFGMPHYSKLNFESEPPEIRRKFEVYAEGINYEVS